MTPEALKVWQEGAAIELTTEELTCLRDALARDDPALIQGSSVSPSMDFGHPIICEGACLLGYGPWKTQAIIYVRRVADALLELWLRIGARMGDESACRHLAKWWDTAPRAEAVAEMLGLVDAELAKRKEGK